MPYEPRAATLVTVICTYCTAWSTGGVFLPEYEWNQNHRRLSVNRRCRRCLCCSLTLIVLCQSIDPSVLCLSFILKTRQILEGRGRTARTWVDSPKNASPMKTISGESFGPNCFHIRMQEMKKESLDTKVNQYTGPLCLYDRHRCLCRMGRRRDADLQREVIVSTHQKSSLTFEISMKI